MKIYVIKLFFMKKLQQFKRHWNIGLFIVCQITGKKGTEYKNLVFGRGGDGQMGGSEWATKWAILCRVWSNPALNVSSSFLFFPKCITDRLTDYQTKKQIPRVKTEVRLFLIKFFFTKIIFILFSISLFYNNLH